MHGIFKQEALILANCQTILETQTMLPQDLGFEAFGDHRAEQISLHCLRNSSCDIQFLSFPVSARDPLFFSHSGAFCSKYQQIWMRFRNSAIDRLKICFCHIIIAVHKQDIFTFRLLQSQIPRRGNAAVLFCKIPDTGIYIGVFAADRVAAVRGAVVDKQQLIIVEALIYKAVQAAAKRSCSIVDRNYYGLLQVSPPSP